MLRCIPTDQQTSGVSRIWQRVGAMAGAKILATNGGFSRAIEWFYLNFTTANNGNEIWRILAHILLELVYL